MCFFLLYSKLSEYPPINNFKRGCDSLKVRTFKAKSRAQHTVYPWVRHFTPTQPLYTQEVSMSTVTVALLLMGTFIKIQKPLSSVLQTVHLAPKKSEFNILALWYMSIIKTFNCIKATFMIT